MGARTNDIRSSPRKGRGMKDPTFMDYKDWKRRHLRECRYTSMDARRSTLSRTVMCAKYFVGRRCMWRWCPLRKEDP